MTSEIDESSETALFVYGTLVRGEAEHDRLAGARFLGSARTAPRYELLDLGAYPALVAGATSVHGELYAVSSELLGALDEYEDHPALFRREGVALADGSRAQAYLLAAKAPPEGARIPSGIWRGH